MPEIIDHLGFYLRKVCHAFIHSPSILPIEVVH
jgi:hypothetical protein